MGRALIVSAGASSNEYISARLAELGYTRPTIIPSGAEARRRMLESDFELIVVNAPLPDEFGHELCSSAVEKTDAGVVLLAKAAAAEQLLAPMSEQGVLLLNTVLTVEQGAANAHAGRGWETFTRAALEYAAAHGTAPLAAVLWGKPAQKYAPIFNRAAAHRPVLVLESAHPSPLSAYRGFFGSAPFGKVNAFLENNGVSKIDWYLPANATHG